MLMQRLIVCGKDGTTNYFPNLPQSSAETCKKNGGVTPKPEWILCESKFSLFTKQKVDGNEEVDVFITENMPELGKGPFVPYPHNCGSDPSIAYNVEMLRFNKFKTVAKKLKTIPYACTLHR